MISATYNLGEFLDAMIGKDYHEILVAAEQECAAAEYYSYGIKGAVKARQIGSADYAFALKRFLVFMRYGARPGGIPNGEFAMYRPICESLVQRKRFRPTILNFF